MRRRRSWIILGLVVAAAVGAIALLIYLRSRSAPLAARLLPESDAVLYADLSLVRLAERFGGDGDLVISTEPEYLEFVRATGFRFERDLHSAALAVHSVALPPPATRRGQPQAPPPRVLRFSEIFVGSFDSSKVAAYLHRLTTRTETHRDAEIFVIPHEGRTVRVAILSVDTVAASNHEDPAVIRGMVERFRAAASPQAGPPLVRDHYHHVPFGSLAWGVAYLGSGAGAGLPLPPAMVPLLQDVTIVSSARFTGALNLRAEAFAGSEQRAQQIADTANTFVAIFKGAQGSGSPTGVDEDAKAFFESFAVKQDGDRAIVTATASLGFLQKLFATPMPQPTPAPPQ